MTSAFPSFCQSVSVPILFSYSLIPLRRWCMQKNCTSCQRICPRQPARGLLPHSLWSKIGIYRRSSVFSGGYDFRMGSSCSCNAFVVEVKWQLLELFGFAWQIAKETKYFNRASNSRQKRPTTSVQSLDPVPNELAMSVTRTFLAPMDDYEAG